MSSIDGTIPSSRIRVPTVSTMQVAKANSIIALPARIPTYNTSNVLVVSVDQPNQTALRGQFEICGDPNL